MRSPLGLRCCPRCRPQRRLVHKSSHPIAYSPARSRQPPPPPPESISSILRTRKWAFTGAMAVAMLAGIYVAGMFIRPSAGQCAAGGRCCDNSRAFDKTLDWEESLMGISTLRARLAARATGHVLETAVGTGRNFRFYGWDGLLAPPSSAPPASPPSRRGEEGERQPARMVSFTGTDISVEMLAVAMDKLKETTPQAVDGGSRVWTSPDGSPDGGGISYLSGRLRLLKLDSQRALPPPPSAADGPAAEARPPPAKYDTVVQSFGFCSIDDPARALLNMAAAVRPRAGRIILLEHGRGWSLVNGMLDRNAQAHFDRYGCWYNRDIEAIVRRAAAQVPGLRVVRVERPYVLQLGTLVWIELRLDG